MLIDILSQFIEIFIVCVIWNHYWESLGKISQIFLDWYTISGSSLIRIRRWSKHTIECFSAYSHFSFCILYIVAFTISFALTYR